MPGAVSSWAPGPAVPHLPSQPEGRWSLTWATAVGLCGMVTGESGFRSPHLRLLSVCLFVGWLRGDCLFVGWLRGDCLFVGWLRGDCLFVGWLRGDCLFVGWLRGDCLLGG